MTGSNQMAYKYATVRLHILNPEMIRPTFNHMIGLMRPLWDLYWCCKDMTLSPTAARATAATKQLFLQCDSKSPSKEQLLDIIMLYTGLKSQKTKVDAALKIAELKLSKTRIRKNDGFKLYNGSWFAEFETTRNAQLA